MPGMDEYIKRIEGFVKGKDPLELQRQTPGILMQLIAGKSAEQLKARPQPNKWSVAEILAHLAEDEIATAWRYRQMLEHSGIALAGFDQDLWAQIGAYGSREPQVSLELFRLLRADNLRLLQRLAPEQWECYGIHAERGRLTIKTLALHMAGHDVNHLEQIRRILN